MKEVPLAEVKDDLSCFLREAEKHEIVITRHGKPAGVLTFHFAGIGCCEPPQSPRIAGSCAARRLHESQQAMRTAISEREDTGTCQANRER
jgi:antitoxin (DNA-binding transcriptional repressor) of toxin-antitoxin stability system